MPILNNPASDIRGSLPLAISFKVIKWFDMPTLKPFYEQILGFNIVNETMTSIQYEVGMSNHFITLNEIANGREPLMYH
jgi:catechol-2,3-dioxygenase